jgi:hypothetical protein
LTRYNISGIPEESTSGEYVKYSEIVHILIDIDRLTSMIHELTENSEISGKDIIHLRHFNKFVKELIKV